MIVGLFAFGLFALWIARLAQEDRRVSRREISR